MKKCVLLFVILIAVLTLTLVAFACQEDRAVETAQALAATTLDGVVLPNELPYIRVPSFSTTNLPVGSFSASAEDGFYYRPDSSSSVLCTIDVNGYLVFSSGYLYIVYTVPRTGWNVFSFSFKMSSSSYVSCGKRVIVPNDYDQTTALQNVWGGQSFWNLCKDNSDSSVYDYLPVGTKVFFYVRPNVGSVTIDNVKLEVYSSDLPSSAYGFSGFVIPDYTYSPEPSPYDNWNGVVRPNLLTHTDFYTYPYYSRGVLDEPLDTYYTDTPSSAFSAYPEDYVDGYTIYPCDFTTSENVGQGIASTLTLNYRYSYRDLFEEVVGESGYRYPVIYSLNAGVQDTAYGAGCRITLADNLFHSVSFTVTDFNTGGGFFASVPFASGEYNWDYIDITVEFWSRYDVALRGYLLYSKLEVGDLFTGFVPEHHNDLTVVQYNLLPNYDFAEVPGNGVAENWSLELLYGSDVTFSRVGSALGCNTTEGFLLYYDYVPEDALPDNTFNFSLKAFTTASIGISVYNLPYSSNSVPYANFGFSASFGVNDLSVSFPAYSTGCRIQLSFIPIDGSSSYFELHYAKLEYGDSFTGYVQSMKVLSDTSYQEGYNQGALDTAEMYTSKTYTLVGSQGALNLMVDKGWSDFGINSPTEFAGCTFSISPLYYVTSGFPVIQSGYGTDTVTVGSEYLWVYASRDMFLLEDIETTPNLYMITIYEDYSMLTIRDERFNNDYLNYEVNRTVDLTVTRGFDDLLEFVNGEVRAEGYASGVADGRIQGYNNGRAVGYSEGLEMAEDGTWRGLVSSLVDVPVTTIVSFLDFEILGFNMFDIFKTIVMLSLLLFIIKFLVGKSVGV